MPELPEVTMMARYLNDEFGGFVRKFQVHDVDIRRTGGGYLPGDEVAHLIGNSIMGVKRRGKFLVFILEEGLMVAHQAMSGYWDTASHPWTFDYVEGARKASEGDVRVTIGLTPSGPDHGPDVTLRFHDARLFGSLRVYPRAKRWQDVPSLALLGPESFHSEHLIPGADVWGPSWLSNVAESRRFKKDKTVKEVLMDQSVIAGVGNIYASEACWVAMLRPDAPFTELSASQKERLYDAVKEVLHAAISRSVRYDDLAVYGRAGEPCTLDSCGGKITKIEIKGRSTFFCPRCQSQS